MRRTKNRKGFTMVELLVTVVILGIISGMSIPLVRNVRQNNEQRKYNSYGDSIVHATKLYVESYGQDLFGYKKTGCAIVTYQQLKDKGLIKEFSDKDITCNSDDTLVRVVKMNKQYGYSYQLYCGTEGSDGKATSPEFKSSSSSRKVNEVIKKQEDDSDKDEDNDGFSDAACNIITSMDIKISPENGTTKAESYNPKVTLMSSTGINPSSTIQYAWVDIDNKNTIPVIDYDAITDWKSVSFTVDSQNIQMQQILSPTDNIVLSKPRTIPAPSNAPTYSVLVLKIDNFRDLEGEYWNDKDNPENQYITSGIFNIGKKYTLTYDNNGGSGCSNVSVLKEKNVDTKWGDDTNTDLCKPTRINYTFTGWNTSPDGSGETITKNTVIESDLTVYAQWRLNRVHFRYKIQSGETLTAQTTSDTGTVYNWTKNSDNYVMQSINNATAKIYDQSVERGTNKTINFANYNNSKFLKIEKTGYHAITDKEWICESGCKTAGQTFDHDPTITIANTDDICDSKNGDCTVTLKVNWTPTIYTITLDKNNGTGGTDTIYEKYNTGWYSTAAATGTPINSITSPTRTGYTFAGYYTEASGGTKIINADGTIVSGKTTQFSAAGTLYAHWTAKTATITFNCNGGTVTGEETATTATQTFTYDGGAQYFSKSCTRTGYTQLGWAATSTATAKSWNTNSGVVNSWINSHSPTATIYAVWSANIYTVTLNKNNGTGGTDTVYEKYNTGWYSDSSAATAITAIAANPTRTGYNFAGYFTTASGGTKIINANKTFVAGKTTQFSANGTLYAHWNPGVYTITLDKNNGTGGTDTIYEKYNNGWYSDSSAATSITSIATNPTRTGYNFTGYFTAATGGTKIINANKTIVTGKTTQFSATGTLYAHWTAKTAVVTYNCNGGTVTGGGTATTATETFTYDGGTQSFGKSCTRTGYAQIGWAASSTATAKDWNTNSGVINSWINSHSPTTTIYAVWVKNKGRVTVSSNPLYVCPTDASEDGTYWNCTDGYNYMKISNVTVSGNTLSLYVELRTNVDYPNTCDCIWSGNKVGELCLQKGNQTGNNKKKCDLSLVSGIDVGNWGVAGAYPYWGTITKDISGLASGDYRVIYKACCSYIEFTNSSGYNHNGFIIHVD